MSSAGPKVRTSFDYGTAAEVFRVLRARATIYAFIGTLIAIILATLLVCVHVYDGITTDNMMRAHRENISIQALDAMPFLFAWWGQYASARMASEAGSMVESRTGELQEELASARFTAQAKTDFFARMSHELRTPINAIVGMSELVMDADDPEQRRHQAQGIHDSTYGLLSLVNDVLDFSCIEAGRMELDDVGFDLHDHLNGTATLLEQQARAKGLRLTALVPPIRRAAWSATRGACARSWSTSWATPSSSPNRAAHARHVGRPGRGRDRGDADRPARRRRRFAVRPAAHRPVPAAPVGRGTGAPAQAARAHALDLPRRAHRHRGAR